MQSCAKEHGHLQCPATCRNVDALGQKQYADAAAAAFREKAGKGPKDKPGSGALMYSHDDLNKAFAGKGFSETLFSHS